MADDVISALPQILMKIQDDIASFRKSFEARLDIVDARLDRLEDIAKKQRRDSAGMLVMMRATVSDYEVRVSDLESRMTAVEARRN